MLAGQVAVDVDGNTVGGDDIRSQTRQVYENIKGRAGGGGRRDGGHHPPDRLYHRPANVPGCMEVRQTYFNEPYPASTLLIVSGLAKPEWLIEIDAIAFVED